MFFVGLYYSLFHKHHSHDGHGHHRDGPLDMNNPSSIEGVHAIDSCSSERVEWDGPTTFVTNSQYISLHLSSAPGYRGLFRSNVRVHTKADVQQPTLILHGKLTPLHKDSQVERTMEGSLLIISYLGLRIRIQDVDNQFKAEITYPDHWTEEDENNTPLNKRPCAELELEIALPAKFSSFGSILVDGPVANVFLSDLETVGLERLEINTKVGQVVARGVVKADQVKIVAITGKVEVDSIRVASEDKKPLDVHVESQVGHISLGLEMTLVQQDESRPHKVLVTSSVGDLDIDVGALDKEEQAMIPEGQKPGDLEVQLKTSIGAIKSSIELFNENQVLDLKANAEKGSVHAWVADEFLGWFKMETIFGSIIVQPAQRSSSVIKYERQSPFHKSGKKIKTGGDDVREGKIELRSQLGGRLSLQFFE